MIQTKFESFIDIFRCSNSFLQHVERFVADHGIDAAGDEARRFFDHHHFLAHALAYFDRGRQRFFIRLERTHNFQQLHFVYGIEEMHPQALLRAIGNAGNFGDAQRRSIGSEDSAWAADFVQQSEYLNLRFHLFRTASMTRSASRAASSTDPAYSSRENAASAAPTETLPSSTALSRLVRISPSALRRALGRRSSRMVRYPPSASACAMPRPMVPAPMTATVLTSNTTRLPFPGGSALR